MAERYDGEPDGGRPALTRNVPHACLPARQPELSSTGRLLCGPVLELEPCCRWRRRETRSGRQATQLGPVRIGTIRVANALGLPSSSNRYPPLNVAAATAAARMGADPAPRAERERTIRLTLLGRGEGRGLMAAPPAEGGAARRLRRSRGRRCRSDREIGHSSSRSSSPANGQPQAPNGTSSRYRAERRETRRPHSATTAPVGELNRLRSRLQPCARHDPARRPPGRPSSRSPSGTRRASRCAHGPVDCAACDRVEPGRTGPALRAVRGRRAPDRCERLPTASSAGPVAEPAAPDRTRRARGTGCRDSNARGRAGRSLISFHHSSGRSYSSEPRSLL